MKKIPYARQSISNDDINAVVSVLKSDFLTQGQQTNNFEKIICDYVGVKYGVAVSSATAALHLAYIALGVGANDYVWTSPNTFVATSNAALYCGAMVDFIDIDEDTMNLSINKLREKLQHAKKNDCLPKVVTVVHFAGLPVDMLQVKALSVEYGFSIVEDASHAIGAEVNGVKIGSCKYSDITVFSFHPVKIITTGEGGMLMTNSSSIFLDLSKLRSHGIVKDRANMNFLPEGNWSYEQQLLGYNYRMTDIQAALGISQMSRISNFLVRRSDIAKTYFERLVNPNITLPRISSGSFSAWHLFVIKVPHQLRKSLYDYLHTNGVLVNVHYMPVYLQLFYKKMGFEKGYCPNAEKVYSEVISLPMYPELLHEDQMYTIDLIENFFKSY